MNSVMKFAADVTADAEDRLEAMQAAMVQADAVLTLVSLACHDTKHGHAVDQDTLSNAIWAAQSLIGQAIALSGAKA